MKKLFYLFVLTVVLIPLNAFATTATFSLECPADAKKGSTITCSLNATATDGQIKSFSGTVGTDTDGDTRFTVGTSTSGTGLTHITGKIADVSVTVKTGDIAGNGKIQITNLTATDEEDLAITLGEALIEDTIKVLNDDTAISSISINDVVNTSCDKSDEASRCSISDIKKDNIKINVTPTDENAEVVGTGTSKLSCGKNTIKVSVLAEDNTKRDYSFDVTRKCSEDTALKTLTVSSGTMNPTFVASTKSYTVEVESTVDKITISAEKNADTQKIEGTVSARALQYGDNKFNIVVTAENGAKATYAVNVKRKDDRSTNNYLQSLEISAGSKFTFDKETLEYNIKVLYETAMVEVTGITEDPKATITYKNNKAKLVVGINAPILITVKSENQQEKVYKVIVEKLEEGVTLGDNPNIANMSVEGYDIDFILAKSDYILKIKDEEKLNINIEMEDATATYEISGNEDLKNDSVITIKTTSVDGTTKEYTITIEKSNILLFIIIAGVTLVAAITLIIYLIVKNRKNKKESKTDKLKKKLQEEELMTKVQTQLSEQQIELTNTEAVAPAPIHQEPIYNQPEPMSREAYRQEVVLPVKEVEPPIEPVDPVREEPRLDATKVCSICGHRVSASLTTCPYCKRSF